MSERDTRPPPSTNTRCSPRLASAVIASTGSMPEPERATRMMSKLGDVMAQTTRGAAVRALLAGQSTTHKVAALADALDNDEQLQGDTNPSARDVKDRIKAIYVSGRGLDL